ncbi:MAG: alkyl hydroperoxide reductase, partial [Planctomycetes bacterium]|nr:alkyl hydroperoxide reductase [Planctomycetota bacterium]
MNAFWTGCLAIAASLTIASASFAADKPVKGKPVDTDSDKEEKSDPIAGHSNHGDAFNEGPRQKAYLMKGTGNVHFAATTKSPLVQKFIDQGVGQLHGFWYWEAERSFRQAAAIDPDCAIAYWGMAMANKNNKKRAQGFLKEALDRKSKATQREKMYIDALSAYVNGAGSSRGTKGRKLADAFGKIAGKYPQ